MKLSLITTMAQALAAYAIEKHCQGNGLALTSGDHCRPGLNSFCCVYGETGDFKIPRDCEPVLDALNYNTYPDCFDVGVSRSRTLPAPEQHHANGSASRKATAYVLDGSREENMHG
ncbi:hypothetical protein BUE80_DR002909 [Diplocarpon rosae]|nr:hypothetical protein BUE80_DR002909 [Diplocarpon rosae]